MSLEYWDASRKKWVLYWTDAEHGEDADRQASFRAVMEMGICEQRHEATTMTTPTAGWSAWVGWSDRWVTTTGSAANHGWFVPQFRGRRTYSDLPWRTILNRSCGDL